MGSRLTSAQFVEDALVIEMHDPKKKGRFYNISRRRLLDQNLLQLSWECHAYKEADKHKNVSCVRLWERQIVSGDEVLMLKNTSAQEATTTGTAPSVVGGATGSNAA